MQDIDTYAEKEFEVTKLGLSRNKFTVHGENCEFFWIVHGKRADITVEPDKDSVDVKGSGPYKWI